MNKELDVTRDSEKKVNELKKPRYSQKERAPTAGKGNGTSN